MIYRLINLTFGLKAEREVNFPAPQQLAQGVYDGLPKEWFDFQDDDDYMIEDILTDKIGSHEEIRLKATIGIRDHQIEVLAAELEQEKNLTKHLDKDAGQRETVMINLEAQVENLIEKNDSQSVIIMSQQAELRTLQKKYDNSLIDWKGCTERNRELIAHHSTEVKINDEMISKIVDAMQGAGFDVGGWGDDKELEELETASTQISDQLSAAQTQVQHLVRFISEAQDETENVRMSIDEASVEQDGLDQLLDHIRTVR